MKLNLSQAGSVGIKRSILVFGPGKTGKTRSLYSLWKFLVKHNLPPRFHVFDFDLGIEPLVRLLQAEKAPDDALTVYRYTEAGGDKLGSNNLRPRGRSVYLNFMKDFNVYWDNIDPTTNDWKDSYRDQAPGAIIIDSSSELQKILLDFVLDIEGHDLGAPNTRGDADHGKAMGKMEEIIESGKKLPAIFVVLAHDVIKQDKTTEEMIQAPYFTGQQASTITKLFSTILFSGVTPKGQAEAEYWWQPRAGGLVKTGGSRHVEGLPNRIPQDFELVLR